MVMAINEWLCNHRDVKVYTNYEMEILKVRIMMIHVDTNKVIEELYSYDYLDDCLISVLTSMYKKLIKGL